MSRVTISDIARQAGLSKGAVSYALNDKPGVSDETRQRVHEIADDLGWRPNLAARSLSTSRAEAIGLVLKRPARMLGNEPFYMEFIAGVEDVIAHQDIALMLHIVDTPERELATYERWWAQRRVDGVLMVDLAADDRRVDAVRAIGIPTVSIASTEASRGLPHLWTDDRRAMQDAVRYLVRLGHRRIARVGGIPGLDHSVIRDQAFVAGTEEAGLPAPPIISTDFSGEAGSRATRALLASPEPPTAIVYDNDIMAVAGLGVASEMGIEVPRELSLLAWDDSPLCRLTHPPLSAMQRDVASLGVDAAEMLLELINNGFVDDRQAVLPVIAPRATTSVPPDTDHLRH